MCLPNPPDYVIISWSEAFTTDDLGFQIWFNDSFYLHGCKFSPKATNLKISSDPCYANSPGYRMHDRARSKPLFSSPLIPQKITTLGNNNNNNNCQFNISRLREAIIRRSFPMTSPSLVCVTNRLRFYDLRRLLLNCRKKKRNKCFIFSLTAPKLIGIFGAVEINNF